MHAPVINLRSDVDILLNNWCKNWSITKKCKTTLASQRNLRFNYNMIMIRP